MTTIYGAARSVALVLDAADSAFLPEPVHVGFNTARMSLTFATVEDVATWAYYCDQQLATVQDAEHPDEVLLGFVGELYDMPIAAHCPMPRVKAVAS